MLTAIVSAALIVAALVVTLASFIRLAAVKAQLERRERELQSARSEARRMRESFEFHVSLLEQERELLQERIEKAESGQGQMRDQIESVRAGEAELAAMIADLESRLVELFSEASQRALEENRTALMEMSRTEHQERLRQRQQSLKPLSDALVHAFDQLGKVGLTGGDAQSPTLNERIRLVAERQQRLMSQTNALLSRLKERRPGSS